MEEIFEDAKYVGEMMRFARKMNKKCNGKNYTTRDLAEYSGVSVYLINKIEKGTASPKLSTISRMLSACGYSIRTAFKAFCDAKAIHD